MKNYFKIQAIIAWSVVALNSLLLAASTQSLFMLAIACVNGVQVVNLIRRK